MTDADTPPDDQLDWTKYECPGCGELTWRASTGTPDYPCGRCGHDHPEPAGDQNV